MIKIEEQHHFWLRIYWHFFEVPKIILKAWKNLLLFNSEYFSIPLLLKTLFSPWHRYKWPYPRGFDIGKSLEVFFSNLITQLLGAILRTFLILIGIFVEIFIFLIGGIIFLGWFILPLLLILGLIIGVKYVLF